MLRNEYGYSSIPTYVGRGQRTQYHEVTTNHSYNCRLSWLPVTEGTIFLNLHSRMHINKQIHIQWIHGVIFTRSYHGKIDWYSTSPLFEEQLNELKSTQNWMNIWSRSGCYNKFIDWMAMKKSILKIKSTTLCAYKLS